MLSKSTDLLRCLQEPIIGPSFSHIKSVLTLTSFLFKTVLILFSKLYLGSNKFINKMQQFHKFITWHFVSLDMFRALPRPSSGVYNCNNSLWFYRWNVAVATLFVVVWPDLDQQRCYRHVPTLKPEAANAVVNSWWWARKHPKHIEPHINVK
jgi:uncharacterized membrane protein